jgi:hypothetical protein
LFGCCWQNSYTTCARGRRSDEDAGKLIGAEEIVGIGDGVGRETHFQSGLGGGVVVGGFGKSAEDAAWRDRAVETGKMGGVDAVSGKMGREVRVGARA